MGSTCTLYIGNLSFYTTEEMLLDLFAKIAPVKLVIMGLDRYQKTPCGFAFVEYYTHEAAVTCKRFLEGWKLDERFIRVDLDVGFTEGRQFGRGKSGGQVRDDYRTEYDPGRGGVRKQMPPPAKRSFIDEDSVGGGASASNAAAQPAKKLPNSRFRSEADDKSESEDDAVDGESKNEK